MRERFFVYSYMETILEQTGEKVIVANLESDETGRKKFVLPFNSQMSNRVKYYIDNGIKDYLETGLIGDYDLIDLNDFQVSNQRNRDGDAEQVYFHKSFFSRVSSSKIISRNSILLLEKSFENASSRTKIYNSNVLVYLQSFDKEVKVFLIAKFEDEDKFIGILETEFTTKRELQILAIHQITELGVFSEIPIRPFSTKMYIETGKMVYT